MSSWGCLRHLLPPSSSQRHTSVSMISFYEWHMRGWGISWSLLTLCRTEFGLHVTESVYAYVSSSNDKQLPCICSPASLKLDGKSLMPPRSR